MVLILGATPAWRVIARCKAPNEQLLGQAEASGEAAAHDTATNRCGGALLAMRNTAVWRIQTACIDAGCIRPMRAAGHAGQECPPHLERVVELDDVGVLHLRQHVALRLDVLDLRVAGTTTRLPVHCMGSEAAGLGPKPVAQGLRLLHDMLFREAPSGHTPVCSGHAAFPAVTIPVAVKGTSTTAQRGRHGPLQATPPRMSPALPADLPRGNPRPPRPPAYLPALQHLRLLELLHGKDLACSPLAHNAHLPQQVSGIGAISSWACNTLAECPQQWAWC